MPELREDLVSGDWVLIAPGRSARPHSVDEKKTPRKPAPKNTCPFEDLQKSGNWPPIMAWPGVKNWRIVLLPNKFPALTHTDTCAIPMKEGIYRAKTGVGMHSLLVTRDHNKNFAELDPKTAAQVFAMLQEWHARSAKDECVAYVSSFMNWGPTAGASIWHPHYQILALPIVPPHSARSLRGAEEYFKKHRRCARCDIVKQEMAQKKRIVAQNQYAIAIAPYASKQPYEVSILPKKHFPYFASTPAPVVRSITSLLQLTMRKVKKNLNDPDVNFFIHDAPLDGKKYKHHHWHVEVMPKVTIPAGF